MVLYLRRLGLGVSIILLAAIVLPVLAVWMVFAAIYTLFDPRIALNALLLLDISGNVILLGAPYQTISERTGWARLRAGSPWMQLASFVCALLTIAGRLLSGAKYDHCTHATSPGARSGYTLWRWSAQPVSLEVYEDASGAAVRSTTVAQGGAR